MLKEADFSMYKAHFSTGYRVKQKEIIHLFLGRVSSGNVSSINACYLHEVIFV